MHGFGQISDQVSDQASDDQVSDDEIAALVDRFYDKVRRDHRLGPIFEGLIAPQAWPTHLATMRDFWSTVMNTSGRYKGNPMATHLRLGMVRPKDFERWLALFDETCAELFAPDLAAAFRVKADRIAQSLQIRLFYRPENDRARVVS